MMDHTVYSMRNTRRNKKHDLDTIVNVADYGYHIGSYAKMIKGGKKNEKG